MSSKPSLTWHLLRIEISLTQISSDRPSPKSINTLLTTSTTSKQMLLLSAYAALLKQAITLYPLSIHSRWELSMKSSMAKKIQVLKPLEVKCLLWIRRKLGAPESSLISNSSQLKRYNCLLLKICRLISSNSKWCPTLQTSLVSRSRSE